MSKRDRSCCSRRLDGEKLVRKMKVCELVELLSRCEQDAVVVITDGSSSSIAVAVVCTVQTGWAHSQQANPNLSFLPDGLDHAMLPRGSNLARGVRLLGPRCEPLLLLQ